MSTHTIEAIEPPPISPTALYTVKEAAERLRVGKTTVYDLCETKQLAHVRVGLKTGIRVKGAALIAFLDRREEGGPAPTMRFKHLKGLN